MLHRAGMDFASPNLAGVASALTVSCCVTYPAPLTPSHPISVLVQPGWHNSGPEHWQSLWEARLGADAQRVQQQDWMHPDRAAWVAHLRAALEGLSTPAILLAHSIGCLAVAHLLSGSQAEKVTPRIAAALLVAPADVEREGADPELDSFRPIPMQPLGIPALVIASTNDPYCDSARAHAMAHAWGADFRNIGDAGHINADAGYGLWPEGWNLISRWLTTHRLAWPGKGENLA